MKRLQLICGIVILVALYYAVNWMFPGYVDVFDSLNRPRRYQGNGIIPLYYLPVAIVAWYFICWINIINEWERRPVMRWGKFRFVKGPGACLLEPIFNNILDDIPVQDQVDELDPGQVLLTKDNIAVKFTGVMTWHIDPEKVKDAVLKVNDVIEAVKIRGLSVLTGEVGKADLHDLMEGRDGFCDSICKTLSERIGGWGPMIKSFELKGFQIADAAIAEAMMMKARATQEAKAELARAEMQKVIAHALNEAAATLDENGWRLKDREVLLEMTRSSSMHTVLIPTDMTNGLASTAAVVQALDRAKTHLPPTKSKVLPLPAESAE